MNKYEKIEWLHFAISEAINGNIGELTNALQIIEQLREPYLKEKKDVKKDKPYCKTITPSTISQ